MTSILSIDLNQPVKSFHEVPLLLVVNPGDSSERVPVAHHDPHARHGTARADLSGILTFGSPAAADLFPAAAVFPIDDFHSFFVKSDDAVGCAGAEVAGVGAIVSKVLVIEVDWVAEFGADGFGGAANGQW